jgi:hypothetical protein
MPPLPPTQSVTKTIFLLASLGCWLIVGAALIYLFPAAADRVAHSDTTATWLVTLGRGGYNPGLALLTGTVSFVVVVVASIVWAVKFDGRV